MKINMEKIKETVQKLIPNTENIKNPNGFFGCFEEKEGYNKLVAYGPVDKELRFCWIHKDYQK